MIPAHMSVVPESVGLTPANIAEVHFDMSGLSISVAFDDISATVFFAYVRSFRLLDEGDVLEYWSGDDYKAQGWVFEVASNGWFDLESTRPGFLSSDNDKLREFLVATNNVCLSILAPEAPSISLGTT